MRRNLQLFRLTVSIVFALLMTHLLPALAWNPPGHMLSGSIAYQVLQRETPSTVGKVKSLLKKHPWYEKHWRRQLNNLPDSDRNEILFMLAPKWAGRRPHSRPRTAPPRTMALYQLAVQARW